MGTRIAVVAMLGCSMQAMAQSPELERRIDSLRSAHRTPGLSVAVVKDGRVLWAKGYGTADPTTSTAATEDTAYSLASLTKPFTATGIMLLKEDGKLSLADPVTKFIPEAPPQWNSITVEHLLTHTSGLADFINDRITPQDRDTQPREIITQLAQRPLLFPPGRRRQYSNSNFLILGEIISAITGQPWDLFLHDRLFEPLGMSSTAKCDEHTRLGFRYGDEAKAFVPAWPLRASVFDHADGGLKSSVSDLARFEIALRSGRILKPDTLSHLAGDQGGRSLGWERNDIRGRVRVEHGGSRSGAAAQYSYFPDDGFTVIVLGNSVELPAMDVVDVVASSMNPAYTPPNLMAAAATPDAPIDRQVHAWIEAVASGHTDAPGLAADTAAVFIPDLSPAMSRLNRYKPSLQQLYVDHLRVPSRRIGHDALTVAYYRVGHGTDTYYPIFFLDSAGVVVDYDAVRYGGDSGIPAAIWIGAGAAAFVALTGGSVVIRRRRTQTRNGNPARYSEQHRAAASDSHGAHGLDR